MENLIAWMTNRDPKTVLGGQQFSPFWGALRMHGWQCGKQRTNSVILSDDCMWFFLRNCCLSWSFNFLRVRWPSPATFIENHQHLCKPTLCAS